MKYVSSIKKDNYDNIDAWDILELE